ncbi:MAG: hypothetical protein CL578_22500 [Alteromonadaceae bacterium]|uniref:hypothetical protein n=1 Tax=unclassified Methylophaga TaxID=2629249 RepID=UPI000C460289|nr:MULTISPECIES: hypothetical protein [unclassified Methylophaga]MBN27799.1 hypothetical protein [Alteromonadaceae bacterium]MAP27766.1 hypothetical protein [Methylophaga sp.]HAD31547.1 hypothetical protein [Methylophaga sp.]HBX59842.1 hypothetical protein [Methylophaga sp.]HCN99422.1 hypothetical protein [Methylophaga sp.]|tara:strand:- start:35055 stop:35342 length:288 start_codon:yes stop_codon:yes gene_type:complete
MSKLTQKSKGTTCIRCGSPDAYSCHYNGEMQHWYGKGRGQKCSDMATAEFCYVCDQLFSEGVNIYHNKAERSEMFLHFIMLTNIRRFNEGVLKVA